MFFFPCNIIKGNILFLLLLLLFPLVVPPPAPYSLHSLVLVVVRVLHDGGRLARPLQPHKHDHLLVALLELKGGGGGAAVQ